MTDEKFNLAQFIETTFENQLNDKTINSTKIISDFLNVNILDPAKIINKADKECIIIQKPIKYLY